MKAIIFGVSGQDGFYLSRLLQEKKVEVIGVSRSIGSCVHGDVSDFKFVKNLVEKNKPDFIFHLAANSTTQHSALFENHKAISIGTLNILESVRLYSLKTKVFISGSAMQFKNINEPIDERTSFEASSAYSVARIQSVYAARYFHEKLKLKVYVGYFFNHDSPLRTEGHINKKIVDAVKRIANGSDEKIEIGDLEVKKEFNFAGDVVEAIWLLVNQENIYEVVIGSGDAHSIKEFTEACFKKINKDWREYIVNNPGFISEYKVLISDPQLIKSLGWSQKTSFEQLVGIMMG